MKSFLLSLLFVGAAVAASPKPLFQSKVITADTPNHSVDIDVDLKGAKELYLVVTDGGNSFSCDWADWAEPRLVLADGSEKKLTEVEWRLANAGFGAVRVNANSGGQELRSAGKAIPYGIGTHANSIIAYHLPEGVQRFKARGALDEGGVRQQNGKETSVEFRVYTENPGPIQASAAPGSSHEPDDAIRQLDIHPEVEAQLFASEPLLLSPASIDIDAKGNVWVCEVVNYRGHRGERQEGDRIVILSDTDGDGKADKQTVFYQGKDVDSAHGICVLGNKALISCGDDVFWLIDDDGDLKADRKEVMFTKIGGAQHDHGIHAFHFGPDGRLYFNFGNAGKQLCNAKGELITDINGIKCTNQNNRPYQEGMVFRCDLDGSNVEMLGWNFRNNWETAVDSFGTLWQSDNDDDGNKGVRINYVMQYGNYGYRDQVTGAGWQSPRLGWESEIPLRHWHLNDPGVVPNLLQTGAGSPTGIVVYEGELLPKVFLGQPIHCDAGPNVVRGYITQPDQAGYKAEILNILEGTRNRWFRPSDVSVTPDGSLIVADWYDPGVGGHGMGDTARGRLFRVTTKAAEKYVTPGSQADIRSITSAVAALKSPNEAARYLGWQFLNSQGNEAAPELNKLYDDKKALPQHRARALWLLGATALDAARRDSHPDIRITSIRLACQLWQKAQPEKLREFIATFVKDDSAAVRREAVLALRFDGTDEASQLWKNLAFSFDGKDRWAVEAVGIAADLFAEQRMMMANKKDNTPTPPNPAMITELVWRLPFAQTPALVASILTSPDGDASHDWMQAAKANPMRFLRQLQLLQPRFPDEVKEAVLILFHKAANETALAAATMLSRDQINQDPKGKERLDALLKPVIGKPEFIALVEKLNLTGFEGELLDYIIAHPDAPESVSAARLIAGNRDGALNYLKKADAAQAKALISALGRVSDRAAVAVMGQQFWNSKTDDLRRATIDALALSSEGGKMILKWNLEKKLPESVRDHAALALSRSTDAGVRSQAGQDLPLPAAIGLQNFPSLPELVKLPGDATKGAAMFMQAGCVACHRVKGQFVDFGPDLTQIGSKLSKEGLLTAILYPSAAIEHSYGGWQITTKEGLVVIGYLISDTDTELTLRTAGGAAQTVKKASIVKREALEQSLMPPGLAATIGAQGLADLVAYLQTLR